LQQFHCLHSAHGQPSIQEAISCSVTRRRCFTPQTRARHDPLALTASFHFDSELKVSFQERECTDFVPIAPS
jgi:hypothetical protein